MRYQIKEALDKISALTQCDPNQMVLDRVEPNNIHLSGVNEHQAHVEFIYTNGDLFIVTDNMAVRLPKQVTVLRNRTH